MTLSTKNILIDPWYAKKFCVLAKYMKIFLFFSQFEVILAFFFQLRLSVVNQLKIKRFCISLKILELPKIYKKYKLSVLIKINSENINVIFQENPSPTKQNSSAKTITSNQNCIWDHCQQTWHCSLRSCGLSRTWEPW